MITKQPRVIECLLRAKADVTLRDRHGNTAAHIACAQADAASLKMLVNRGLRHPISFPDLGMHNYEGNQAIRDAPIRYVVRLKRPSYLVCFFEGLAPAHLAVLASSKDTLKLLTSSGADMDVQVSNCHLEIRIEILPRCGKV